MFDKARGAGRKTGKRAVVIGVTASLVIFAGAASASATQGSRWGAKCPPSMSTTAPAQHKTTSKKELQLHIVKVRQAITLANQAKLRQAQLQKKPSAHTGQMLQAAMTTADPTTAASSTAKKVPVTPSTVVAGSMDEAAMDSTMDAIVDSLEGAVTKTGGTVPVAAAPVGATSVDTIPVTTPATLPATGTGDEASWDATMDKLINSLQGTLKGQTVGGSTASGGVDATTVASVTSLASVIAILTDVLKDLQTLLGSSSIPSMGSGNPVSSSGGDGGDKPFSDKCKGKKWGGAAKPKSDSKKAESNGKKPCDKKSEGGDSAAKSGDASGTKSTKESSEDDDASKSGSAGGSGGALDPSSGIGSKSGSTVKSVSTGSVEEE